MSTGEDRRGPADDAEMSAAIQKLRNEEARQAREQAVEPSLKKFAVEWDNITPEKVGAFRDVLRAATVEPIMQAFLAANPSLLIQPLGGGHGRWVIPESN